MSIGSGGGTPLQVLFKILGIAEGKASLKPIGDEVVKIQASVDKLGASMGKALSATNVDSSKIKTLGTDLEKASTSQDKLSTSATKAAGALDKEGQSAQQLDQKTKSVGTSVDKIDASNKKMEQSSTKASQSLTKQGTEMKKVGDESAKSTTNIEKGATALDKTAISANKTSASTKTLSSSFASTMGAVTSLSGGIVSLWSSYDSLGDAQLKVDKAQNKLTTTTIALSTLENQRNKLIQAGKEGTTDYAIVEERLALQHNKVEAATGTLINAQEDLNVTQANFYTQIIPQTIAVMGSLMTLFANGQGIVKGFGTQIDATGKQISTTSRLMSMISLTNPFFLALTIGGGILTAFITNMFGFRDAVNWVGEALGNMIPVLKPFLTMIGDLGKGLAGLFGMVPEEAAAMEAEVTDSMEGTGAAITGVATTANRTTADLKQYGLDLSNVFINAKGEVVGFETDFSKSIGEAGNSTNVLATATETNVNTSIESLDKLSAALTEKKKEWDAFFSKSADLGSGIKLTGFAQNDPNTVNNLQKETSDRFSRRLTDPGAIDVSADVLQNLEKLVNVTTRFDGITKKLHVNLPQLRASMDDVGLSAGEQAKIEKELVTQMDAVLELTSRNVSEWDELAIQAKKNTAAAGELTSKFGGLETGLKIINPVLGLTAAASIQVGSAMSATASAVDETGVSIAAAAVAQNRLTAEIEAVYNEQTYLTKVTGDYALMTKFAAMALMKQQNAMKQQQLTLIDTVVGLQEYNKQLGTSEGIETAVYAGRAKQLDVLVQSKVAYNENIGVLEELNIQLSEGELQAYAFADAFQQTLINSKNVQVELAALNGEIAATAHLMTTGEAQTNAYNLALANTEKTFLESIIALEETKAQIDYLTRTMATGEAQTHAMNQGFLDTSKSIKDAEVALSEAEGSMAAFLVAIDNGTLALADFKKGQQSVWDELINGTRSLDDTRGKLQKFHALLMIGVPQFNSYNQAILDQQMAFLKLEDEISGLMGTYSALMTAMTDTYTLTSLSNQAFFEAAVGVAKWGLSLETAEGATNGTIRALTDVATTAGVVIPIGFRGGEKAIKEFISYSAGAGSEFETLMNKLSSDFESMTSGLGSAMREGNKELGDAIDEMEEKLGFEFDQGVRDALKFEGGADAISETIDILGGLLSGMELPQGSFDNLRQQASGQIQETLDDIPEEVRPAAEGVVNNIVAILNRSVSSSDEIAVGAMIGDLNAELVILRELSSGTAKTYTSNMGIINSTAFDAAKGEFKSLQSVIEETRTAIFETGGSWETMVNSVNGRQFELPEGQTTGGTFDASTGAPDPSMTPEDFAAQWGSGGGGGGGGEPDTSGIDTALTKINAYNLAVSAMITTTTTAVTQSNAQFALLNPMQAATTTSFTTLTTALGLLGPAAGVAVGAANLEFDKLNPAGPGFQTNVATFGTVLATMGPAVAVSVAAANVEFDLLNPAGPGFQANVQTFGTVLATMGPATALAVNAVNTELERIGEPLTTVALPAFEQFATDVNAGPFTNLQNDAAVTGEAVGNIFREEADKIPGYYDDMVSDVNSGAFSDIQNDAAVAAQAVTNIFEEEAGKIAGHFQDAAADVNTAFGTMETKASSTMSSIVQSANEAANAVGAVVNIINQMEDKTVTLTTIHEDIFTTTTAAAGFGPTIVDHPTMLMVGEAGPEYVNITPLSTSAGKNFSAQERLALYGDPGNKGLTGGGLGGMGGPPDQDEISKGYDVLYLAQGTTTNQYTGVGGFGNGTTQTNTTGSNTSPGGIFDTRLLYVGNKAIWNNAIPVEITNTGIFGTGSSGTGGGGGGGGGGSNGAGGLGNFGGNSGGGSSQTNTGTGGNINQSQTNNQNGTNNTNNQSDVNNNSNNNTGNNNGNGSSSNSASGSSGATVPAHVKTSGSGSKWQGDPGDFTDWDVVEMTDADKKGKYKVINRVNGRNIATEFNSKQEADDWLATYHSGTGANGGNGSGDTAGYTRRPVTDSEGFHGQNPQTQFSQVADVGASSAIRNNLAQTPGINARNEVELTSGERYTIDEWNAIPDTHRKVLAENQGFFAIPEGAYINEDYSITPHHYQRPIGGRSGANPHDPNATRQTTSPSTGGGSNSGGNTGGGTASGVNAANLEALQYANSNIYASGTPPPGMTYGPVTSGRYVGQNADRNRGPEDWFIKKQPDGKFKVINGLGEDIAVDFNTLADAQNWINYTIQQVEKNNPGREAGSETLPIYRDKTTGKVYAQDASGKLYEKTGNYSDYTSDPSTTAGPIPNTGGGANGGNGNGSSNSGGNTGGGGSGNGAGGSNGGTGTQIPGYNGNFNYQINGRQLKIEGGKIVTNTLTAADWPVAQAAFLKMTGKTLPPFGGGTSPTTPPPPTTTPPTTTPGGTSTGNFNPGFSNGIGNAPINGGFPGISNLYRPQSGSIGVGGIIQGPGTTPTTPTPTTPMPGLPGWINDLFGGLFGNIFGNLGGTGGIGGDGSSQSISKQWTDANGNNFNIQSDINTRNQVNTGTGGSISQSQSSNSGSGGSSGGGANGSGMSVNPNGIVSMGGMIVDGQTGKVTMSNGMIVDGATGTVIMPNGSNGNGGSTGVGSGGIVIPETPTDAFGNPYSPYPTRARTGSAAEGARGPFRSGQDLTKPFFDWMAPAPYVGAASSGVLGANINPATGGAGPGSPGSGNGGSGGLPDIQNWMDWFNNVVAGAFRGISINLSTNAIIDSTKVYESQQKFFGIKLGTLIK